MHLEVSQYPFPMSWVLFKLVFINKLGFSSLYLLDVLFTRLPNFAWVLVGECSFCHFMLHFPTFSFMFFLFLFYTLSTLSWAGFLWCSSWRLHQSCWVKVSGSVILSTSYVIGLILKTGSVMNQLHPIIEIIFILVQVRAEEFFNLFFSDDSVSFHESFHRKCGDKGGLLYLYCFHVFC